MTEPSAEHQQRHLGPVPHAPGEPFLIQTVGGPFPGRRVVRDGQPGSGGVAWSWPLPDRLGDPEARGWYRKTSESRLPPQGPDSHVVRGAEYVWVHTAPLRSLPADDSPRLPPIAQARRAAAGLCVLCPVYQPDSGPEVVVGARVCGRCQVRAASDLAGIRAGHGGLREVLARGSSWGQRVSGSRTPPAPLRLGVADLLTPAVRLGGLPVDATRDTLVPHVVTERLDDDDPVTVFTPWGVRRQPAWRRRLIRDQTGQPALVGAGDQDGVVPVAQFLDAWARDWIAVRGQRETRPDPTVTDLWIWLHNRLDWALEHHPAIADFAAECRELLAEVRRAIGDVGAAPERCDGVHCRYCGRRQLFRRSDGSGTVECHNVDCQSIYDADSYRRWVIALHARARAVPDTG